MTDTERLLRDHGVVKQRIKALERDIAALQEKKQDIYEALYIKPPDKTRVSGGRVFDAEGRIFNPVAEAVIKAVDVYADRIKDLTADINAAMMKLAFIESIVRTSGLDEIEKRFVRLRYFDGLSITAVCMKLGGCSARTAMRIRASVIGKIEKKGERAQNG